SRLRSQFNACRRLRGNLSPSEKVPLERRDSGDSGRPRFSRCGNMGDNGCPRLSRGENTGATLVRASPAAKTRGGRRLSPLLPLRIPRVQPPSPPHRRPRAAIAASKPPTRAGEQPPPLATPPL